MTIFPSDDVAAVSPQPDARMAVGERDSAIKLSDIVYAKIAGRIRSGDYPIDSRLPNEIDLAEALGVSRPIVREALARLRNDGAVKSRRGSGTYVQRIHDLPVRATPLTSIADMRRCLEFRTSIEGEAAWHAALGRGGDRSALHAAMARLDADYASGILDPDADFAFHRAVAESSGNRFFHETMDALRASIITAMQITPNFAAPRSPDRLRLLHAEHRAVYDAIVADDVEGARTAMRRHLTQAMHRVFDGV